jgi:hypothetical protein
MDVPTFRPRIRRSGAGLRIIKKRVDDCAKRISRCLHDMASEPGNKRGSVSRLIGAIALFLLQRDTVSFPKAGLGDHRERCHVSF